MLNVMITIDTELWPDSPDWPHTPLAAGTRCERELEAYFFGGGAAGFGLPYQLRVFHDAGLKAIFFVEPLFSFTLGAEPIHRGSLAPGVRNSRPSVDRSFVNTPSTSRSCCCARANNACVTSVRRQFGASVPAAGVPTRQPSARWYALAS